MCCRSSSLLSVVLDVFQHVDVDDGVETLVGSKRFECAADDARWARMTPETGLQLFAQAGVGFQARPMLGALVEVVERRSYTGAHVEHRASHERAHAAGPIVLPIRGFDEQLEFTAHV